jgi:hypothetical protein
MTTLYGPSHEDWILGDFPLRAGWAMEPQFVALLATRIIGLTLVPGFTPVTDQLQVSADINLGVV